MLPTTFCNKTLLVLIKTKAALDVTKKVKIMYQIASTIEAVRTR